MFDFKSERTEDKTILTINGELTIQNAAALQGALIESLEGTEHLVLNFENVTEVDISCLQLLCSAHSTIIKLNRSFTINSSCPEAFKKAAVDSGYLQHETCATDCDKNCLRTETDYSQGGI